MGRSAALVHLCLVLMPAALALPCRALAEPQAAGALGAAAEEPPELGAAEQQMEQGRYEEAVRTCRRGLKAHDLTADQTAELYRMLGLAYLYLGEEEHAQQAYARLLELRPDFQLPASTPPKIRAIYDRLRAQLKAREALPSSLTLDPLGPAPGDFPVDVVAHVTNLPPGGSAHFYFRRAGTKRFSAVDLVPDPDDPATFRASVPGYALPAEAEPYWVDYYAELTNARGKWVAGEGDEFEPHQLQILGSGQGPAWYRRPWVWGVGGALVAGAVVGTVLLLIPRSGTLTFTLQVKAL